MGIRRAIIFLGVSIAALFLASGLLPTEPSAQTTSPEGKIVYVKQGTEPSVRCDGQPCDDLWVMDADGTKPDQPHQHTRYQRGPACLVARRYQNRVHGARRP